MADTWTADDILAGNDESVYAYAGDRLAGLGLHTSHRWVHFAEGDCWHGIHAGIKCELCETVPVWACYHELPYAGFRSVEDAQARGVSVKPAALEPCPGRADD